jgi:hypothetical protein
MKKVTNHASDASNLEASENFESKDLKNVLDESSIENIVEPVVEVIYFPKPEAVKLPRWFIHKGEKVAIGRAILIEPKPPKTSYTIPEATPAQYEEFYNMGLTHLIDKK